MNRYYVILLKKNNYYAFLTKDKKGITRRVEEACHIQIKNGYTQYGYSQYIQENWELPRFYKVYCLLDNRVAQTTLDESYPLPRKSIPKKVRKQVYDMFNGHCAYCGCEIAEDKFDVDHLQSHMMNKGIDDISNYYPACKDCNKFKMCSDIERFRKNIKDTIRLCSKRNENYLWDRIYRKYGLDINPQKEIKFLFEEVKQDEKID